MLPISERQFPYFQRAVLLVANFEKAFQVYQGLLGFELDYMGVDAPDSYSYLIFDIDHNIQTRFATLNSIQQQRTLALIEVPNQPIYQENQMKISGIVVQVSSVEQTLEKVTKMGLKSLLPVRHDSPAKGPGRIEAAFYDFDGHPVVIYQIL